MAETTRLRMLMLIHQEGELCVCELTHGLDERQPKVSRHLATLRACGLLITRREGQWIYYRLPATPAWVRETLAGVMDAHPGFLAECSARLARMGNRPERQASHCQ